MLLITIIILICSLITNAMMDAIDHMKRSSGVFELWHLLKAFSYGILWGYILYLCNFTIWGFLLAPFIYMLFWELSYKLFLHIEIYKWDDALKIKFIRLIWGIKR